LESYELNIYNYSEPRIEKKTEVIRYNAIPICCIKNGKFYPFPSCYHAARFFKAKNVNTTARNILKVCKGERNTLLGMQWFYESDYEKYKELI
jgi:hypothetical protein